MENAGNLTRLSQLVPGVIGLALMLSPLRAEAAVIEVANPTAVSHWLSSGDMNFGFSELGGGYLACMLPGADAELTTQCPSDLGDENLVSPGFGRGWQMATRDNQHRGRHNPTQAGFNDDYGAPASLANGVSCHGPGGRVHFAPFPLPIFGNKLFDWVENEDIIHDGYSDDGGGADNDGIDESGVDQDTEVRSEWDYTGFYEDASDLVDAEIGIVRHIFRLTYARPPDAINQFGANAVMDSGVAVYNPNAAWLDMAPDAFPPSAFSGPQLAAPEDYASGIVAYSARVRYSHNYRHMLWVGNDGAWHEESLTVCNAKKTVQVGSDQYDELYDGNPDQFKGGNPNTFAGATDFPLVILSTSGVDGVDTAHAVGAYLPASSPCNELQVVGVDSATDQVVYAQDRRTRWTMVGNRQACGADPGVAATKNMGVPGEKVIVENDHTSFAVRLYTLGQMAPGNGLDGVHEGVRMELYLLTGTPSEIRDAVVELEASEPFADADCSIGPSCPDSGPGSCQISCDDAAECFDATCGGVDDDCDGDPGEDFARSATHCGSGVCASMGQTSCSDGVFGDSCNPGQPSPNDVTCDGVDDDCDGAVDEGFGLNSPGDLDGNGVFDVADVQCLVLAVLNLTPDDPETVPQCLAPCRSFDVNCDAEGSVVDVQAVVGVVLSALLGDPSLPVSKDLDGDNVHNGCDLCPETFDPDQHDSDGDWLGDLCDPAP